MTDPPEQSILHDEPTFTMSPALALPSAQSEPTAQARESHSAATNPSPSPTGRAGRGRLLTRSSVIGGHGGHRTPHPPWHAALVFAFTLILTSPATALAAAPSSPPRETIERAQALAMVLWAILLLTIVFLTGVFVLRALQRARQRMAHNRAKPTEYTDAWSMHRIPEDVLGDHPADPPAEE